MDHENEYSPQRNTVTPSICIVGAGISGLLAAIRLKTELGITSVTIFEENEEVGGSWLCKYPGHCSESLAHLSSYSFELKSDWPENYASQKEMSTYLQAIAHKYGIYSAIKFNSQVKSLTWDAKAKKWNAIILNKKISMMKYVTFDMAICATGSHREALVPDEFSSFKGPILHTRAWDDSIDLEDKVVGVVGSGLAAVQLIPAIESKCKMLHYYQQSPSWILPRLQFQLPLYFKKTLEKVHILLVILRWFLFGLSEIFYYPIFLKNSLFNQIAHYLSQKYIGAKIGSYHRFRWLLEPKYPFGFKPILHSNDFYNALEKGKVMLHCEPITLISDCAVTTSRGEHATTQLDVLILSPEDNRQEFFGPMKIIDKYSQDLLCRWKNSRVRVRTYFGLTTSVTPNLFFLLGPHTTILHNSSVFILECQVHAIVKLIQEMTKRCTKVIEVEESAEDDFLSDLELQFQRTIWNTSKNGTWFTNCVGAITSLWPWSSIRYWFYTRRPDYCKFRFY